MSYTCKRFCLSIVVLAVNLAFADDYSGYVKHTGGSGDSFTTANVWNPSGVPSSGFSYYVGSSAQVGTSSQTSAFGGDRLVVAGMVQQLGNSGTVVNWGNTEWLPGSTVFNWTLGTYKGTWTVSGTTDNPSKWTFGRGNRAKDERESFACDLAVKAGADNRLQLNSRRDANNIYGPKIVLSNGDWTQFHGTLRCLTNAYLYTASRFTIPGSMVFDGSPDTYFDLMASTGGSAIGNLQLGDEATLTIGASEGTTTFGDLSVGSRAKVRLSVSGNTHVLAVTNRLGVGEGAQIESGKTIASVQPATSPEQVPASRTLISFTEAAVANGIPVAALESAVGTGFLTATRTLTLPRTVCSWKNEDDGGRSMALTYRRYVAHSSSVGDTSVSNGFKRNGASFWSDGQYPVAGSDYYTQTGAIVAPDEEDIVGGQYAFPGNLFAFDYHLGVMSCNIDMNLVAVGRASDGYPHPRIRFLSMRTSRRLSGSIEIVPNGNYKSLWVQCGDLNSICIDSSITGDGNLSLYMDTENAAFVKADLWRGWVELTGNNRSWRGRMIVLAADAVKSKKPYFEDKGLAAFVPSAVSNITLVVHGPANLGGPMSEFTYDALCVSNQNRLVLADTAVYNETSRGWFFPETAYLGVKSNAVAKVMNVVTIGGELVKEDTGSVMFAELRKEEDADAKAIAVREGAIGALSAGALDGMPISFSAGTGLVVEANPSDPILAEKGFTCSDVGNLTCSGTISVTILGIHEWTEGSRNQKVSICTVPTSQAEALMGKLRVKKPAAEVSVRLSLADNGDGTSTLRAICGKFGFAMGFR